MKVPFNDLNRANHLIKNELESAFQKVLNRSRFIQGEETIKFEQDFASYLNVQNCVGCGNATDALEIILLSLGVGIGDEVIVPANTYLATAEAVVNTGANPVFVDVDPVFHCISSIEVEKYITSYTRAIIVVHLYGCPVDMDPILQVADKYRLYVVEDCAQAHGAEYKGKKVGGIGDAAAFSFYPTKNLGALGDGGVISSQNNELAEKCRMLANHGSSPDHGYKLNGRNSRLDELQSAFLNIKLKYLDKWNFQRAQLAHRYIDNLHDSELIVPANPHYGVAVWHLFVVLTEQRDRIQAELLKRGVQALVRYNKILPELPPFKDFKSRECPTAKTQADLILSLPIFPEMTMQEVDYVCETLKKIL